MTVFNSITSIDRRRAVINRYLERRQLYPFQIAAEPSRDLGLLVVIPCFDEPDFAATLSSLAACDPPGCDVEILIVVNGPDGADRAVLENNLRALHQVAAAGQSNKANWLRFHGIHHEQLPIRQAGVGLARKIGMDEAAGRIARTRLCDGVIASLDADCQVAGNYLHRVRHAFLEYESCPGFSVYFEHPIAESDIDPIQEALRNYELHLRYYVAGQRCAGFPYAFHTIGSAMACRGSVYAGQGGMNRRQGGEDFYFIQKLIALGGYRALNSTTVYPQIRLSERVPFGTGPAIKRALDSQTGQDTFAPEIFRDLEYWCRAVAESPAETFAGSIDNFPEAMKQFLAEHEFAGRLAEIRANVAGPASFNKRLFRWFNAFRFMKYAQFASRHYYPKIPVASAARQLAASVGRIQANEGHDPHFLLSTYRKWDRETSTPRFLNDCQENG